MVRNDLVSGTVFGRSGMRAWSIGLRRAMKHAWQGYNRGLVQRPVFTKSLVCLVGFAIGDLAAQTLTAPKTGQRGVDWKRTANMAAFGFCFQGPVGHVWYNMLDRTILPTNPASPLAVVSKVAADQLLMAPIGMVCFYAWSTIFTHGLAALGTVWPRRVRETLPVATRAAWTFWPLAHTINFRFIPTEQRMLYINLVAIGWNAIFSYVSNRPPPAPAVDMTERGSARVAEKAKEL